MAHYYSQISLLFISLLISALLINHSTPFTMLRRLSTRQSSKLAAQSVKVTSYNVLSSHLAGPSHFTSCKPEFLDAPYRLKLVKGKLEREIDGRAIICLQEISHAWAGKLHSFFSAKNYHFVTACYGNKFNGYMGVGIAVPMEKYEIEDVNVTRVADTKWMPRAPKPTAVQKFFNSIRGFFVSLFMKFAIFLKLIQPKFDFWDNVLYRHNQMICARLKQKEADGKSFVVGTYHMPCMFKFPGVMVTHCALSAQHIRKYASGLPFVYTGDFNIKPDSSMYELLTKGTLDKNHPDYPEIVKGDDWTPDVPALRSAYAAASPTGEEPNFTNYAKVKDEETFIETLDYIFLSDEWQVVSALPLPHRDAVVGPLPNEDEPSDHILISADVVLAGEK